jgi:hypothetical protein
MRAAQAGFAAVAEENDDSSFHQKRYFSGHSIDAIVEKEERTGMKMLKRMTAKIMLGTAATALVLMAVPVQALEFDPDTLKTIDEMIMKMQQETMQKQYEAMPLRRELPGRMMNNMYNYASNAYRQNIQPQMVQSIIGTMRPWEFPDRFRQAMMPSVVGQMSGQIKNIQLQYMQQGIADPSFPNVIPRSSAPQNQKPQ